VTAAAEFNFYCDPEAAHVTIHNMKCPITIFPWEAAYKYGRIPYVSILYGSHLGKQY
jgi:inosine-uridine nucleoside N-ribohydrolase